MEKCQRIVTVLQILLHRNRRERAGIASTADELMKFKSLLDCGATTQAEYEAEKKTAGALNTL